MVFRTPWLTSFDAYQFDTELLMERNFPVTEFLLCDFVINLAKLRTCYHSQSLLDVVHGAWQRQ